MLRFFSLAFSSPKIPKNPKATIEPDAVRRIVSSRSHGNVRLQAGKFYTQDDVDAKFVELNGTRFVD